MDFYINFLTNYIEMDRVGVTFDLEPFIGDDGAPDNVADIRWENDEGLVTFKGSKENEIIYTYTRYNGILDYYRWYVSKQTLHRNDLISTAYKDLVAERDGLLEKTDWIVFREREYRDLDDPNYIGDMTYHMLLNWRRNLRFLPQMYKHPIDWVWPKVPIEISELIKRANSARPKFIDTVIYDPPPTESEIPDEIEIGLETLDYDNEGFVSGLMRKGELIEIYSNFEAVSGQNQILDEETVLYSLNAVKLDVAGITNNIISARMGDITMDLIVKEFGYPNNFIMVIPKKDDLEIVNPIH